MINYLKVRDDGNQLEVRNTKISIQHILLVLVEDRDKLDFSYSFEYQRRLAYHINNKPTKPVPDEHPPECIFYF